MKKKFTFALRIVNFVCWFGIVVLVFMKHPPQWYWHAKLLLLGISLIVQTRLLVLMFIQSRKKEKNIPTPYWIYNHPLK